MKYNEFDNPREKQQVRPVTTMDPKELGDRIEKAKAKAFKKPEQPDLSQLWAKEKPATEDDGDERAIAAMKVARDEDRMIFHGKEIDQNSIQYEMQDYSDGIFELHGANYIDGTELDDKELEELESTDELQEWVRIDYVSEDEVEEDGMTSADVDRVRNQNFTDKQIRQAYRVLNHPSVKGGNYTAAYNIINRIAPGLADHPDVANALRRANEGFIGKKMEYTDFLQNKLDSAIQEYDTPEKKAERDALMQKYLNKGGKVEKVPAGKTAYKNKELKPAYRKDNGTPITSPGSDESVEEDISEKGRIVLEKAGFDPNAIHEYMAVFNDHGDTTDLEDMNTNKIGVADAMAMVLASHDVENESTIKEDAGEDEVKQWAEKYRQYKNLEDDNLVKALYDYAFDLGITQFIFEIGELQAAERELGKKQEDWEDTEINAAMEMSPISDGLLDELYKIIPEGDLEDKLTKIRPIIAGARGDESVQEDEGEQALANDLSTFFAKTAREFMQSMENPNPEDQEYQELTDIAQAFKKGIQAGLEEVHLSKFEFSNNPFGDFGRGIDDGPDEELVDILNQHGYQPGPDGDNDKASILKQQEESAIKEDGAPFGSGMELLRMAIMRKFITVQEWDLLKHKWRAAADEVEERYSDWPEGEGFGSSDHNFAIRDLMSAVGYEFDDQDTSGRFIVTKQPEEIEKAGIKNARMKGQPVATEGGMPSSIIKHKQKLANMSDEELADRFKDFDEKRLRHLAWGHGYGKMSSHYLDRVKNHMTSKRTGTYESKLTTMLNKRLK